MIQAVLFDMDGTLVDSEMLFVQALGETLDSYQLGLNTDSNYLTPVVYGRSRSDITNEIIRDNPAIPDTVEELNDKIDQRFEQLLGETDIEIDGSVDCMRALAADFPIAIVSGSTRHHLQRFIKILGIEDVIEFYIGAEDYAEGKPNPTCFLLAAERLNVDPTACLVFEDSQAGIKAAKSGGMHCVAIQRAHAHVQDVSLADQVVSNLREFSLSSIHDG